MGTLPVCPQHAQGAVGKLRQSLPESPGTRLWLWVSPVGCPLSPPGHAGHRGGQQCPRLPSARREKRRRWRQGGRWQDTKTQGRWPRATGGRWGQSGGPLGGDTAQTKGSAAVLPSGALPQLGWGCGCPQGCLGLARVARARLRCRGVAGPPAGSDTGPGQPTRPPGLRLHWGPGGTRGDSATLGVALGSWEVAFVPQSVTERGHGPWGHSRDGPAPATNRLNVILFHTPPSPPPQKNVEKER